MVPPTFKLSHAVSPDESIVREIMHHGIVACAPATSVAEVAHRMITNHISAVVVVDDDGYLEGIVSQTDLVMARQGRTAEQVAALTAGDILTPNVVTCTPDAKLAQVITLMTRNHIHRLVVAETRNFRPYPVGIVSMTDIVRQTVGGLETIEDDTNLGYFGADPM